MKTHVPFRITIFCFLCFFSIHLLAQSPGFNYQAVARDNAGTLLDGKDLTVHFSLLDAGENLIWKEAQSLKTNGKGMFSTTIFGDNGLRTGGSATTLDEIDWSVMNMSLQVEIDYSGSISAFDPEPLSAVPYAQYAINGVPGPKGDKGDPGEAGAKGDKGDPGDPATDDQTLSFSGTTLTISGGNNVNLAPLQDGVTDPDADPTNEIQDLQWNAGQITLSDDPGNTVIDIDSRISTVS